MEEFITTVLIVFLFSILLAGSLYLGWKAGALYVYLRDNVKYKVIKQNENTSFIRRLAFYFKNGSIKIHLITSDDNDAPHTHPWNFTSFLIIPYKEYIFVKEHVIEGYVGKYKIPRYGKLEYVNTRINLYHMFSINKKECNTLHRTKLYTIFGIKIPALTIGWYGTKVQLCSFCQELGYCKEQKKVEQLNINL